MAIDREAGVPGPRVYVFSKGCYMYLTDHFLSSGVRRLLEGRDDRAGDMVFTNYKATGIWNDVFMTVGHRVYSDFVSIAMS